MKRKLLLLALGALLVVAAVACSSGESKSIWTLENGEEILASGAFSEELEELDGDTAWALYKLEQAGLARETMTESVCRRSAGATCEELALLVFDTEEAAQAAQQALENYLDSQIEANRDYRPGEISKLEGAWLEQRGYTLLMVVADDVQAARQAVGADT